VQAIIKADIVPRLLQLLATDELMRWKVAKVVKYITRGNAPQIEYSTLSSSSTTPIVEIMKRT
jgi:hypothetical protein